MLVDYKPKSEVKVWKPLSVAVVEDTLSIYKPDHMYVVNAEVEDVSLRCELKQTIYPYTKEQVFHYITAPTATIYACQLAYVLLAAMVIAKHPMVASIRGWDGYCLVRDRALLRFADFDIRFVSEVANAWRIPASMQMTKVRLTRKATHCVMEFEIADGIRGKIHGVLLGANS